MSGLLWRQISERAPVALSVPVAAFVCAFGNSCKSFRLVSVVVWVFLISDCVIDVVCEKELRGTYMRNVLMCNNSRSETLGKAPGEWVDCSIRAGSCTGRPGIHAGKIAEE